MADLVRRNIEWIGEAPVQIAASAESSASPAAVFAVLADHEQWPQWFPSVRKVEVTGAAEGVGARRRVTIPGTTVDEEFIIWEPGVRWAFTGTAARPRFTRSLIEDCRLRQLESGGTAIEYTMYLDPPPLFRPFFSILGRQVKSNNAKALANLARRAAEPAG